MSRLDELRKQKVTPSQSPQPSKESRLDRLRATQAQQRIQREQDVINLETNQMRQAQEAATPAPIQPPKETYLESLRKTLGSPLEAAKTAIGQAPSVGRKALDIIGRPSQIIAEYATPSAPLIGREGIIPGTNARQAFLERTGQRPATGFAEKALGTIAAPFAVPGAGLGAGTGLYRAAGEALETLAPRLGSTLGGRVAREGLREAAVGGALGAGQELATGEGDLKQAAISGAVGGALGGTLGAAGPLVGAAARKVGGTLERLRASRVPTAESTPTGAVGAPQVAAESPIPRIPAQVEPSPPMKQHWFTNLFGDQGVGITPSLRPKGRNILTTEGQIVEKPLRRDIQGAKNEIEARARSGYQDYVDEQKPLRYISDETYDTAQDVRRANNLANTMVQDKFVDLEGNVIGEGLKNTIQKVARGRGNEFEDYLILRHAKTRMERGENVYDPKLKMTPETVQERINMYEKRYPEFTKIGQEWDQYHKNIRDTIGVKGGRLISQAQADAMEVANPNYASMRRQFTTAEKYAQPFAARTKGFSGQKAPIKEVSPTGSIRKIVSPIRSAIEATGAWTNAAMRNRVMLSILDRLKANPESFKGLVEIVGETAEASKKSLDEINNIIKTDGIEGLIEQLDNDFSMLFKKGAQKGGVTDNTVTAMVDGTPVKLKIENPEVFKALVGMGPEESNLVMDALGALSNAVKYGATGPLAPLFAAKSVTTDVVTSLIQSKQPLYHMYDLAHSIFSAIANKLPQGTPGFNAIRELAQDFSRTGGEYSAMLMGDRPLRTAVKGMIREPIFSASGITKAGESAIKAPFKVLHSISDISENINRVAAYKGALRRLGGNRTPENIRQAMREAQEITTNYSRKGSKTKSIEKAIPYSNAAVQGIRRFAKQFQDNPVTTLGLVGLTILAPKSWEYAQFSDDPDYQKLPAREKYRNIIVKKNDDGTFVKLPMPPEYNAIGAFMVDLLTAYKDGDPVNWRQTADALVNAYTPPFISGAAQGLTQGGGIEQSLAGAAGSTSLAAPISVISNRSFTGAPIETLGMGGTPKYRYDERTSAIAKKIGEVTGFSPMKTDYLIRAYGGDLARLVLPLTSQVGAGTTRNTLIKNFIVDPTFTNTLTNDFYGAKEKIKQAEDDYRDHKIPYPSWYDKQISNAVTSTAIGSISKKLSVLKDKKKSINADTRLNAEQKAKNLREIQSQMNDIYLDINSKLHQKGVPTK